MLPLRSRAGTSFARPVQASILTLLLVSSFVLIGSLPCLAQTSRSEARIDFNIPAQPLARALVAYGTATGLEIFYNAALADRQNSFEVAGSLTPTVAHKPCFVVRDMLLERRGRALSPLCQRRVKRPLSIRRWTLPHAGSTSRILRRFKHISAMPCVETPGELSNVMKSCFTFGLNPRA